MNAMPPPEWRTTSTPPIEPARFGKDHYSTLLYVESRAVDHRGLLDHDRMRCHGLRHPVMLMAKRRTIAFGTDQADGRRYPTLLRDGIEQPDHDDYDCLDDLLAAGWLTVTMPRVEHALGDPRLQVFIDDWGKPVVDGAGELLDPAFLTGMGELWLCTRARWGLTDAGHVVNALLRQHKEAGGTYATFPVPAGAPS